jgi:AcrR family transcriptional regulator
VAAILEAAAHVFEASGIARATTNAIAQRAGVSIGSLYQFFPSKEAILEAVIEQYQGELRAVWDRVLSPRQPRQALDAMVGASIDAIWALAESRPGFLALLSSGHLNPNPASKEARLLAEAQTRIAGLGLARHPTLSTRDALRASAVISTVIHALLVLASNAPKSHRAALVAETKRVVMGYVRAPGARPLRA